LRLIFNKVLKAEESFLGMVPSFDSIPSVARVVDSEILRNILKGINEKMSMEINYQSMSRDQPIWRKIAPHTLAYDGFRWHIRAYCYTHNEFRDFLLVRILELKNLQPAVIDSSTDSRWHHIVEVKIEPHPGLSDAQKKVIERDYGMENGAGIIRVRAALYFYLEKHLGLDAGCSLRPANEQQIVLANRDEIEEIMAHYRS
jgi:predicted DNA-binding transcriptional regulator YafY